MATAVREVILDLLRRFPNAPTKTLASKAYTSDPSLWRNLEACRSAVRYYRGACGKQHRKGTEKNHPDVSRPPQAPGDPFAKMPVGMVDMPGWGPVEIPGPCNALLLGDIHAPYHDTESLVLACREGVDSGVDTVILLGDFMDCFAVSHWEKDPRRRNFKNELVVGREVLAVIREIFPKARIIYKLGNHDERFERYLMLKAPELLDVEDFSLPVALRCAEHDIQIVTDFKPIILGKLYAIHGHEYRFAIQNPVNPARGLFLRSKVHTICAHFHQSSHHSEKSLDDNVVSCFSLGCLCDMRPRYMPFNKWNLGFARVTVDEAGGFQVHNKRIIHGEVWA